MSDFHEVQNGRIIRELPADRMKVEYLPDGSVRYLYLEGWAMSPGNVLDNLAHWLHHDPTCGWQQRDPIGCTCGLAEMERRLSS